VALVLSCIMGMTAGCALPVRLTAVPERLQASAELPGFPGVRYFAADHDRLLARDAIESIRLEEEWLSAAGHRGPRPPARFLAISGGGENGAFGAGLLVGWTANGSRPDFKVVTGVSTGALTAPFAFLGSQYDAKLRTVYTDVSAKDIVEPRGLVAALLDDALGDTTPLRRLVHRLLDDEMIQRIAAEHRKGRLLLIGTTNLDGRRGVIWNVGKIASGGHPRARQLIEDILVASAAIPGLFPPVMFDVEVDGQRYQEMHVDGGASAQVFAYPPVFQLDRMARSRGVMRERQLYVVRNARLEPDWKQVDRRTLAIAGRSISAMIQNQGIGDLYRLYATSERDGVEFNLAIIPDSFQIPLKEPFDRDYMRELFKVGFDLGRAGYRWLKAPPGLEIRSASSLQPSEPGQPVR
jgi:hypothetical protein